MSIIQRRADSDAKSGKYVAAIYMRKQYLSTDYGETFIESNKDFTYLPAGAAIAEKTGEIFVVTKSTYNSVFVSRDNFATADVFALPGVQFDNVGGVGITNNGETLYILDINSSLWTINTQTNAFTVERLNTGYEIEKLAMSSNGKYRVLTGKKYMFSYNDYGVANSVKEIASPSSTYNALKDVVMTGDGKYVFYSFESGSSAYAGTFRLHQLDNWATVDRISVYGLNDLVAPLQICVSYTGKHIILRYTSYGNWISHDFGRSFTKLPIENVNDIIMSSNGKYIYYRYFSSLYRSNDYGNTFSLVLDALNSSYVLAISK